MKFIIYLFLIISPLAAHSQIQFDRMINTRVQSNDIYVNMRTKRISCSKVNNDIAIYLLNDFMLDNKSMDEKQTVYFLSPAKTDLRKVHFRYPRGLHPQQFMDIAFSKNYMFLLISTKLFRYIKNGNEYVFDKELENRYNYNNIDIINDSMIALNVTYNFHPKDQKEKVVIATLNINEFAYKNETFPEMEGVEFSFFNHNWVCAGNNMIVYVADPLRYSLKVFNQNLEATQTININPEGWSSISREALEEIQNYRGKDQLFKAKTADSSISRVLKIFFVSANKIIVLYKLKGVYQDYYYDIIELTGNTYHVSASRKLIPQAYPGTEIAAKTNFFLREIYNSDMDVITDNDNRSFYLPTPYYYPMEGNETIAEIKNIAKTYRKEKNKTMGLNKFMLR